MARIGHYELVDRYAVGGAAEIFRAHDTRDGELVVIKRVRSDMQFEARVIAGFLKESELALQMHHKNLIRGLSRAAHQGLDYVVLEFVDGQDLSQVLRRAADRKIRIPLEFSLFIMQEVLDGLHFAHDLRGPDGKLLGLVHRDLSPRNVFVSYDGSIRVADFGAALFTRAEPEPVEVIGSPGYLSPEQARLEPLDRRSDVFAAGCMFYGLVTGTAAFNVEGKSDAQMLKLHAQGRIPRVPDVVPEAVREIIETACARDPDERYPTAAAMRDQVSRILVEKNASTTHLAIAALTRHLFKKEFESTRLPGSPLTF